jgi:hypothetical protein
MIPPDLCLLSSKDYRMSHRCQAVWKYSNVTQKGLFLKSRKAILLMFGPWGRLN